MAMALTFHVIGWMAIASEVVCSLSTLAEWLPRRSAPSWDAQKSAEVAETERKERAAVELELKRQKLSEAFGSTGVLVKTEDWGYESERLGKLQIEFHDLSEDSVRELATIFRERMVRKESAA